MQANYLEDLNRFRLAGPPRWWLHRLWDFDNSLVVVPSRQDCVYRLAQRRRLNLPDHIVNEALFNESDTKMLASYSLVPVTTIIATANWSNPLMFKELSDRAPWRNGGAEQVTKRLDAMEAAQEAQKAKELDDHNTIRAKDAWKLYQAKTGQRKFLDSSKQRAWVKG